MHTDAPSIGLPLTWSGEGVSAIPLVQTELDNKKD